MSKNAPAVFQSATKAAASRAQSIASELRIDIAGIRIEADIRVSIKNIEVKNHEVMSGPTTRLHLEWEAARMLSPFSDYEGGPLNLSDNSD